MHDASTVFFSRRCSAWHRSEGLYHIISSETDDMMDQQAKAKKKSEAKQSREHYCTSPRRAS
jgi:hypothetical protein